VDALVQPCILELVGRNHAVPILVSELMFGDEFNFHQSLGKSIGCAASDEGWVLHSSGLRCPVGRVDNGQSRVGILSIPLVKFLQRSLRDLQISVLGVHVIGLQQQPYGNFVSSAIGKRISKDPVLRIRSPGEIMNVVGVVGDGLRSVAVLDFCRFQTGCAVNEVLRQGELDVVGSKVGEKLRIQMELVTVPGALPPDANFGEPLPTKDKVALVSGAGDDFWELVVESDAESDFSAGRNRLWK